MSTPTDLVVATHSPTPQRIQGRRAAIALVCWLLSSVGVFLSLVLTGSALMSLFQQPLRVLQSPVFYAGMGILYAWVALAVMTWGWLRNRPVHWHWPLLGTMIGLLCMTVFALLTPAGLLLIAPCAMLGFYLDYFHATTAAPS